MKVSLIKPQVSTRVLWTVFTWQNASSWTQQTNHKNNTTPRRNTIKHITSRARDTGKATVRDSASAGESQQTENMAAAAATTPNSPLPMDLLQSLSNLTKSRSFNCTLHCVATVLYEEKHGNDRVQALHFLLFLRWLKVENGDKREGSEFGFENLVEIGESDSIVWGRMAPWAEKKKWRRKKRRV